MKWYYKLILLIFCAPVGIYFIIRDSIRQIKTNKKEGSNDLKKSLKEVKAERESLLDLITDIFRRRDIYCTWCGSRQLKYLEGERGEWFWEYRNKDGSQDKRVSGNFQQAKYISKWQCKKCDAVSKYNHYVHKKPSKARKVHSGWLVTDGTGERNKTDYDRLKDSETVNTKNANRKGDN